MSVMTSDNDGWGLIDMCDDERWFSTCQDAGDGSGDLVIDLPSELLSKMGLSLGDELNIEVVDGVIVLTPIRQDHP
ncbi:AbrB/MazE/SpoVT family DNA-binding domain-containing protein [Pseudomonas arsenicoxydans]